MADGNLKVCLFGASEVGILVAVMLAGLCSDCCLRVLVQVVAVARGEWLQHSCSIMTHFCISGSAPRTAHQSCVVSICWCPTPPRLALPHRFGAPQVSLRDALRGGATDEELRLVIAAAVRRKRAAHAGMFELAATANRPMTTIGG
jgi:hypothetical protein